MSPVFIALVHAVRVRVHDFDVHVLCAYWADAAHFVDGAIIDLGLMTPTTYHAEDNTAAALPGSGL
ncbi:hypothetical protein OCU04_000038 [Sclerotinia nivalis]|uniref:Uncharacterized protein n=1 Tax=Sclerotinia nivalis TaxID=352851 RepID=A0A9X0DPC7_9HELO|nr:hypothetical protein OCU04_000038 [Sclerotinia nivalis]